MSDIRVAQLGLIRKTRDNRLFFPSSGKSLTDGKAITVKDALHYSEEFRVLANDNAPNSLSYPKLEDYLVAEANDGLVIAHLDQTWVITQTPQSGGTGGGSGTTISYTEQKTIGQTTNLDVSPSIGAFIIIKNNTAGNTTINGNGKNIESDASITLISGEAIMLRYNGTNWLIVGIGDTLTGSEKWVSAPSSSIDTGIKGQMAVDSNYLYICTATNIWIRTAIETSFP